VQEKKLKQGSLLQKSWHKGNNQPQCSAAFPVRAQSIESGEAPQHSNAPRAQATAQSPTAPRAKAHPESRAGLA